MRFISSATSVPRSREVSASFAVDGPDGEVTGLVVGRYFAGHPGCYYLPNGDPGFPPEPPEVEDVVFRAEDGRELPLTDFEHDRAVEALWAAGEEAP